MRRTLALVLLSVGVIVAAAGCGGDDDDEAQRTPDAATGAPTVGRTSTAVASPSPPVTSTSAAGRRTGIAVVDQAIVSAAARDAAALQGLVRMSEQPCTAQPGLGGPPACEAGEAEGTPVEVFPSAQCEGAWFRRADIAGLLERFLNGEPQDSPATMGGETIALYAVFRTPANYFPAGPYSAVFALGDDPGMATAREIVLSDEGVVGLNFGCGENAAQLVQTRRLTDAIVPPDER